MIAEGNTDVSFNDLLAKVEVTENEYTNAHVVVMLCYFRESQTSVAYFVEEKSARMSELLEVGILRHNI